LLRIDLGSTGAFSRTSIFRNLASHGEIFSVAVYGLNPALMAYTCAASLGPDIAGPQGTPSAHASSLPLPPSATASSSRVLVIGRDRPSAQGRRAEIFTSERSTTPAGLPPLSSTTLPSVSGGGSHGQSHRKKPEGGLHAGLKCQHERSRRNLIRFEAGKMKQPTAKKLQVVEEEVVFQPPLGWPFSDAASHDFRVLESVGRNRNLESLFLRRQAQGVIVGDDEEPLNSTGARLYSSWFAPPRDEEEEDAFIPMLSVASQSTPPPRQKQESSERDNFYANSGSAIRTLREELPCLFYKDLSFDIYRDDVVFRDPMNTFEGIDNYKLVFWALRFHGRIFFKALWVDIVRVWQPSDKVIMVRWTVRGIPRVPWETQGHFDGTSEYKLDKDGRIYEHKVDNVIMNSPPKFQPQSVLDLVRVAGGHTTPTPSFFQRAGIFFCLLSPYLQQFTWVRFYWALKSTLALTSAGDWCSELVPSLNS
jgi:hypothetical protein